MILSPRLNMLMRTPPFAGQPMRIRVPALLQLKGSLRRSVSCSATGSTSDKSPGQGALTKASVNDSGSMVAKVKGTPTGSRDRS
jgi:hypothetical protein